MGDAKTKALMGLIEFSLVIMVVDGLNITYYIFMFKLKLVEIEIDECAQSPEDVYMKI